MSLPDGEIFVEEGEETVLVVTDGAMVDVDIPQGELLLLEKTWEAGADGLSAYQVAVQEGFAGTEAAWLNTLRAGSVLPFAFHVPGVLTSGVLSAEYLAPWECLLESARGITVGGEVVVDVLVNGTPIGSPFVVTTGGGSASLSNLPVAAGDRVGVQLSDSVEGFSLSVTITAVTD